MRLVCGRRHPAVYSYVFVILYRTFSKDFQESESLIRIGLRERGAKCDGCPLAGKAVTITSQAFERSQKPRHADLHVNSRRFSFTLSHHSREVRVNYVENRADAS